MKIHGFVLAFSKSFGTGKKQVRQKCFFPAHFYIGKRNLNFLAELIEKCSRRDFQACLLASRLQASHAFEPESSALFGPPSLGMKHLSSQERGSSKGRNDWPGYTTGAHSPGQIRTAVAGFPQVAGSGGTRWRFPPKSRMLVHYTTGLHCLYTFSIYNF